jgi:hypothetical protein
MIDAITLNGDMTSALWLPLPGVEPGKRGTASVKVTYNGAADARIAMYAHGEAFGSLAQRLRISVFVHAQALMPFPVFGGTLADLTERTSYSQGVGRWIGRGDGADHTVVYEVAWSLPKGAEPPDGEPKLGLVWEARSG